MHSHGTGPVEDKVLSGETSFGVFVAIGTLVFAGLFLLAEQAGLSRHFSYLAAAVLLIAGIAVPALQARTMSTADWMVARGSVNRVVAAMALAASLIAGWMLPVAVGQFFAGSPLAIVWIIAPLLALALGAFAIVPFLKQAGAATPGDLVARRFDIPAARLAYGGVAAAAGILLLWSQLRFAGLLGGLLFPVEPQTAILITSALAGLVVLLSGLRGVVRVNAIIFAFLATAFLAPIAWIAASLTGFPVPHLSFGYGALGEIGDIEQQLSVLGFARLGDQIEGIAATGQPLLTGIVMALFVALGLCAMPFVLGNFPATRSPARARRTAGWAIFLVALVLTAAPALASFAKLLLYHGILGLTSEEISSGAPWLLQWSGMTSIFQDGPMAQLCGQTVRDVADAVAACGGNPDYVIGPADLKLAGEAVTLAAADIFAMPAIFGALLGAALLAGTVAGANAVAFSIGSNMPASLRGAVPEGSRQSLNRLFRARLATAIALVAATWLAIFFETQPVVSFLWAMAVGAAILMPVLVGAIWWRGMRGIGAASGIVAGGLVLAGLAWADWSSGMLGGSTASAWNIDLAPFNAALFALPATLVAIITGSLLVKPRGEANAKPSARTRSKKRKAGSKKPEIPDAEPLIIEPTARTSGSDAAQAAAPKTGTTKRRAAKPAASKAATPKTGETRSGAIKTGASKTAAGKAGAGKTKTGAAAGSTAKRSRRKQTEKPKPA